MPYMKLTAIGVVLAFCVQMSARAGELEMILDPAGYFQARSSSQPVIVKGRVTDEEGQAMPGINVQVKGSSVAVLTDASGEFTIHNVDKEATLVFSGVNIQALETKLNGRTDIAVTVK